MTMDEYEKRFFEMLKYGGKTMGFFEMLKSGGDTPQPKTLGINPIERISHSYINSNIVEISYLQRSKHKKLWLVMLATRDKRKINELVRDYAIDINGLNTKVYVNIIPLGSYDYLIGMDWLEKHHDVLDC
jgi:hypothetical protein